MKKGDRVRDKFKLPRPGDESTTGTILKTTTIKVTIEMDSGSVHEKIRIISRKQFEALYEIL